MADKPKKPTKGKGKPPARSETVYVDRPWPTEESMAALRRLLERNLGKSWQESTLIGEALRGRPPDEVSVVYCDGCGSITYYNDGSHCTCEHCVRSLDHLLDADDDHILTMADVFDSMADDLDAP